MRYLCNSSHFDPNLCLYSLCESDLLLRSLSPPILDAIPGDELSFFPAVADLKVGIISSNIIIKH